jgi:putative glutathione S-transferase
MLNTEFNAFAKQPKLDLYPLELRDQIDALNAWIYPSINNGVYRSGFAQSQQAHETAVDELFDALDRVEEILQTKRYLCGDILTEADIRLFATLIRFDAVYHTHFKCNRKLISQYPAMHQYMSSIFRMPGIAATIDMEHIRFHYFYSHRHINPTGIVPRGPDVLGAL